MILRLYKRHLGPDPDTSHLLARLRRTGYPRLTAINVERVLRAEGLDEGGLRKLAPLFAHPVIAETSMASKLDPDDGHILEVSYNRAMTDPEWPSIQHAAKQLNLEGLVWARTSMRYQLVGLDRQQAMEVATRYLLNLQVQTWLTEEWSTLVPQGQAQEVQAFKLIGMSLDRLKELSDARRLNMPENQLIAMQRFFVEEQRWALDGEIEMIAAAWSDHCSHTTWKALGLLEVLQEATARINHPLVVSAYVDNSGVMRLYNGWCINLKGETHISPTFAGDPYGGILTKHGGVIRDIIFTGQGAYPIFGTTVMATCDPRISWQGVPPGAFHPRMVLTESIRGTHDYTNPMGIPMAWSQYLVDPRNWKGLALGHSVGVLPERFAQKGQPQAGDFVVLIGGPTGLDGLHGATVSSGSMTSETAQRDAAHVQIGMPIEERKFMEAVPVLRDAGCIRASTDCGAAGLSSAVGEMGSPNGVWVNQAWLILKCAGMASWEKWLSESQERGVLAVPPDKLSTALEILKRFNVPVCVIGMFTESGRCQVVDDPSIDHTAWLTEPKVVDSDLKVVDLPYSFLSKGCPLPEIRVKEPVATRQHSSFTMHTPTSPEGWVRLAQEVLGHYNICDQSAAAHRFDQTVQGKTALTYVSGPGDRMPDELFVSAPIFDKLYGVGAANAVNQFCADVSPAGLGRLMVASAVTKLVAAGFSPSDITLCANVYTPPVLDSPENARRLVELVRYGYAPASVEMGTPVISGKDSSSGRFKNTLTGQSTDAPLTLDILAVGRIPDVGRVIPKAFQQPGHVLMLFTPGLQSMHLGGSVLYDLQGQRGNQLPEINLNLLRDGLCRYYAFKNLIRSRSAIAEGGLFRRVFECCFGSGYGCDLVLPSGSALEWLFCELHGSILFTVDPEEAQRWGRDHSFHQIGVVTKRREITVRQGQHMLFRSNTEHLGVEWKRTFAEVVA